MSPTELPLGFGTLLAGCSTVAAILLMLAIGAAMEAFKYAQNPYMRARRAKIMSNKIAYVFG